MNRNRLLTNSSRTSRRLTVAVGFDCPERCANFAALLVTPPDLPFQTAADDFREPIRYVFRERCGSIIQAGSPQFADTSALHRPPAG